MDNNPNFSLNYIASDPKFDFLKTMLKQTSDDNFTFEYDFSESPYDDINSSCYIDEIEFISRFRNFNNLLVMSLNIQSLNSKFNSLLEFLNVLEKKLLFTRHYLSSRIMAI
jgi:hypothetical protein